MKYRRGGGSIILTLSRILTWGGGGVQHRLKNSYVINECSLRVGHGKWIMMAGHFFDGSYIYKQDLSRVFFIIHHLPSQFCRFLRDKNGKKWQISAGYNSCYSGSILLGVVTR